MQLAHALDVTDGTEPTRTAPRDDIGPSAGAAKLASDLFDAYVYESAIGISGESQLHVQKLVEEQVAARFVGAVVVHHSNNVEPRNPSGGCARAHVIRLRSRARDDHISILCERLGP